MLNKFSGPISLGLTAGSLALGGAAYAGFDAIFDILKNRYITMNKPIWEAQGLARLYGDYSDTYSYIKGQEALYKGMYEIPYRIAEKESQELVDNTQKILRETWDQYKINKNFERLIGSPEIEALGKERARALYDQIARLAPNVIRKAPNTALSIMQTAVASDSMALRPEVAYNLARAEYSLQ